MFLWPQEGEPAHLELIVLQMQFSCQLDKNNTGAVYSLHGKAVIFSPWREWDISEDELCTDSRWHIIRYD